MYFTRASLPYPLTSITKVPMSRLGVSPPFFQKLLGYAKINIRRFGVSPPFFQNCENMLRLIFLDKIL